MVKESWCRMSWLREDFWTMKVLAFLRFSCSGEGIHGGCQAYSLYASRTWIELRGVKRNIIVCAMQELHRSDTEADLTKECCR